MSFSIGSLSAGNHIAAYGKSIGHFQSQLYHEVCVKLGEVTYIVYVLVSLWVKSE